jgi:catechol 2,3-dioxygenase-like lactoylglutathione lyase family enzyme
MLSHISFSVADLKRSAAFYDAALAPLGYTRVWTAVDAVGYGEAGGGDKFAIKERVAVVAVPSLGFHLAFDAATRAQVDSFHAAALAAGGTENGPPGLRLRYGPTYYAAFVIDPDGYPIEAVCQNDEGDMDS